MSDSKKILIVDDHKGTRNTLSMILTQHGFDVTSSDSLKSAQNKIKNEVFNLAIIDVILPDGDGLDLIIPLKKSSEKLPIIIMSGNANLKNTLSALNLGVTNYLLKPVKIDLLLLMIEDVFEKIELRLEKDRVIELLKKSEQQLNRFLPHGTE